MIDTAKRLVIVTNLGFIVVGRRLTAEFKTFQVLEQVIKSWERYIM